MPIVELDMKNFSPRWAARGGLTADIAKLEPGGKQAYVEPAGDNDLVRGRILSACVRLRKAHGWRYSVRRIEYGGQTCVAVWRVE